MKSRNTTKKSIGRAWALAAAVAGIGMIQFIRIHAGEEVFRDVVLPPVGLIHCPLWPASPGPFVPGLPGPDDHHRIAQWM